MENSTTELDHLLDDLPDENEDQDEKQEALATDHGDDDGPQGTAG
jgi:hypothetical protein